MCPNQQRTLRWVDAPGTPPPPSATALALSGSTAQPCHRPWQPLPPWQPSPACPAGSLPTREAKKCTGKAHTGPVCFFTLLPFQQIVFSCIRENAPRTKYCLQIVSIVQHDVWDGKTDSLKQNSAVVSSPTTHAYVCVFVCVCMHVFLHIWHMCIYVYIYSQKGTYSQKSNPCD